MPLPFLKKYLNQWTIGIVLLVILGGIILLSVMGIPPITTSIVPDGTCPVTMGSTDCPYGPKMVPLFSSPTDKIAVLKDPAFTGHLFSEARALEPLLSTPGTQVHMGFWSGKGNHGSMLRLLDAINEGPAASASPPSRAIWDEGVTAYYNYPSHTRILDEHWYERASGLNGTVSVFGRNYTDPYPVTSGDADEIWGQYSARYTDLAEPIAQATGRPVKAWCFIEGAKAKRIFFAYELPQLRQLEQKGFVQVRFATTPDADWTQPGDWINGTANVPAPS
jgi:hypothetical protein